MESVAEKAEKALQIAIREPDLLTISGSRLYGTNRENSDYDYRGFVVPPYEYLTDQVTFEMRKIEGADHNVFSLKEFLKNILNGDPQLTEMLYIPQEKIVRASGYGVRVLALKEKLVSNTIYRRITGYGYSEWRKAMGVKLEVDARSRTEDEVVNDIRNVFGPDRDDMDHVIDILMAKKPRKLVSSTGDIGAKRKAEFEKFGFGVSSAAHAIRLQQQLVELLTTGNITFPRPNGNILLGIRQGKYSKEQVEVMFAEAQSVVEDAFAKSVLPDKPDVVGVKLEYDKIVRSFLKQDPRFNAE